MSWSLKLFSFRGIDVRVHVSFVLILIWAAYYWGAAVDDGARGVVFGIIATVLLFACVTLHEFGHAIQAQKYGIGVEDITLLPIGGLARLDRIPEEPKQEFRIAIAGPLVNVAIAVVLALVALVTSRDIFDSPGTVIDDLQAGTWDAMLSYLLFANVWLVLFNLIPAFPMDGGRILRSLLAMRMPHARATRIAALVGQGMALLLGLVGFATVNVFLILIAIFVWFGASQESGLAQTKSALGDSKVGQIMTSSPQTLHSADPLSRPVELTLSSPQADFAVVDKDGYVTGLLTLDRLVAALRDSPLATVGDVMRRDFLVTRPDETVAQAQARLGASGQRTMVVLENDGRLVGMLGATDIAEAVRLFEIQPQLAGARPEEPPVEKMVL